MTSNIGANEIVKERVGFLGEFSEADNNNAIKKFFSPEFRNRLDAVINFKMLNEKNSLKIVDKFLMELESQLMDKNLSLNVTSAAKKMILDLGFDLVSGARPMARVIQEKIKIPLSEFILKSKNPTGTIKVDFSKNKKKFILQYDSKDEKKLTFSS